MKQFLFLLFFAVYIQGFSQVPQLINYQGAARDAEGKPVSGKPIGVKMEILEKSSAGTVAFTETFNVSTNSLGLFNLQIGTNGGLGTVSWLNGPYFLRVSIDVSGGSSYTPLGTQQVASVPYALFTPPPAMSFTGSVLTVNGSTVDIPKAAPVTLSAGTNVSLTTGPDYTITVIPSLAVTNNSLSISGGNTVQLPTPSISGTGLANVNNSSVNNYVVDVPVPVYSSNGILSFGSNNVNILPQLSVNNGSISLGTATNSIPYPVVTTVNGNGMASVTGAPNYTVTVPQPTLTYNALSNTLGISGGNAVSLPAFQSPVALNQGGIVSITPAGSNTFNVTVPLPAYDPLTGILSFGAQSSVAVPTLMLNSSTLSVGPPSNSVNLGSLMPWAHPVNAVTLTAGSDRVGIGSNASSPGAKLDVQGESTLPVPVIKVVNSNGANASAAVDIATNGGSGLNVVNTSPGGLGANFNSTQGIALTANNNSSFYTFQATNSNTLSTSYAGYFDGGFVSKGKGAATNMIISARNPATTDVFVVRNDGNVGIGTNSPTKSLDVIGSVKITDGTEGLDKVLTSDAAGNASWQPISLITTSSFGTRSLASVGATPTNFASPLTSFTKVNTNTKVQVIVQTHILVDDLNGVNSIMFEVKLNGTSALNNTGRTNYFKDNGGSGSNADFVPVTLIAEFASGLPGSTIYNVNITCTALGGAGTGGTVYLDPGAYNASSVIIKEYR